MGRGAAVGILGVYADPRLHGCGDEAACQTLQLGLEGMPGVCHHVQHGAFVARARSQVPCADQPRQQAPFPGGRQLVQQGR